MCRCSSEIYAWGTNISSKLVTTCFSHHKTACHVVDRNFNLLFFFFTDLRFSSTGCATSNKRPLIEEVDTFDSEQPTRRTVLSVVPQEEVHSAFEAQDSLVTWDFVPLREDLQKHQRLRYVLHNDAVNTKRRVCFPPLKMGSEVTRK